MVNYWIYPVWPRVGVKSNKKFPINAQKVSKIVFYQIEILQNRPKSLPNIWANFKVTFVAKNFQKLPNLVTLDVLMYYKLRDYRIRMFVLNNLFGLIFYFYILIYRVLIFMFNQTLVGWGPKKCILANPIVSSRRQETIPDHNPINATIVATCWNKK